MKEHTLNPGSLKKVDKFFQSVASNIEAISLKVTDIAEGAGVALATAHKAIKELERTGVIKLIKPSSRREAVQYIYKGTQQRSKQELEHLVRQLESENKLLKERLAIYEEGVDKISIITVDESLQLIVRRK